MRLYLLIACVIVALCALGACGDKEEGGGAPGENPFGVGDTSTPPASGDWTQGAGMPGMPDMRDPDALRKMAENMGKDPEAFQEQMKDQLEKMGLGNMPDPNDEEAMRDWQKDMYKRGAEMMDRLAGEASEDDLQKYVELRGELEAAKGDPAKVMALYKQHGGMMALQKVLQAPAVLAGYKHRRDAGTLTDKDKANASLYEKYLKLLDE
jgi:hypothetical protein